MTGTPGPNDPCHCGSGKKYKKCHRDRDREMRPRERAAYFGFNEKPKAFVLDDKGQPKLDENGLPIVVLASGDLGGPDAVFTKTHYERDSGKEKVVDFIHGAAAPHLPSYLASRFDVVFGIDTNTWPIGGDLVSATCFIECHVPDLTVGPEYSVFPIKNCQAGMEERFGWSQVVGYITSMPGYSEQTRVALIVDHDLGNHPKFESRELPIYGETFLPPNFKLIYASADTGREGLNGIIAFCDKFSTEALREFKETGAATIGGSTARLEGVLDLRRSTADSWRIQEVRAPESDPADSDPASPGS